MAAGDYLLDGAEEHRIELNSSCRGGVCGTCVSRLVSGQVSLLGSLLASLCSAQLPGPCSACWPPAAAALHCAALRRPNAHRRSAQAFIHIRALCPGQVDNGWLADLDEGSVLSKEQIAAGWILACSAKPLSDCVVEANSDWGVHTIEGDNWKAAAAAAAHA